MLYNSQNHFISDELKSFFQNELGLTSSDVKIPPLWSDEEYEGSHINWTSDRSKFCYINKHRLSHYDLNNYEDLYNYQKRFSGPAQATTTPKFRRIFAKCGVTLSAAAEAKLDAYFATKSNELTFEIIDTPSEIYTLERTFSGSLGGSCMQGKPASYFEMYDDEDCFQLLVAYSNGNVVGRSLLVNANNRTYMDRRYGNDDNIQLAMQEYGLSQGWYIKANNNMDDVSEWLHSSGESIDTYVELDVDIKQYGQLPYMDTFKYALICSKLLITESVDSSDVKCTLNSTIGGASYATSCDHCGDNYHEDDLNRVFQDGDQVYVCDYCRDNEFTYCDNCDEYHNSSNEVSNYRQVCDSCLEDNYQRCDECEEYSHEDNVRYFSNCDVHICEDCI